MSVLGARGLARQYQGRAADQADLAQVAFDVERQVAVQRHVHDHLRAGAQADGQAVGRGLGHHLGAQRAAGARLVLDDHRLAQRLGHVARQLARDQVVGAAGGEADDDADRAGPRRLREGGRRRHGRGQARQGSAT
ncbi:MAG: hypothetical protein V9G22_12960 [Ottowia sp.]